MLAHALLHSLHAGLHRSQPRVRGARAGGRRRLQQGWESQEQHRAHAATAWPGVEAGGRVGPGRITLQAGLQASKAVCPAAQPGASQPTSSSPQLVHVVDVARLHPHPHIL